MGLIKALIFDMGGVIIRSEDYSARIALAQRFGLTLEQLEDLVFNSESAKIATIGKISEEEHWKNIWDALNVSDGLRKEYEKEFWAGDRFNTVLVKFITKSRAQIKTGLLSNAWSGARTLLTEVHPCIDVFDVAVFSFEVGLAKPEKAIYELILDRLKTLPEETIFVDDFSENIKAAEKIGIHVIQFKSTDQAISEVKSLLEK